MSSRNWCFTLNNFTEEEKESVKAWDAEYLVFGEELGEKEETPHLQGYVEFRGSKKLTTLKKMNGRIHWEIRKGTRGEAIEYCKKDGKVFEKGNTERQQGKRSDLDAVKAMVKQGKPMKEIWEAAPSYQAVKMAEIGIKLFEAKRTWKTEVYWLWGPTGTGKTRQAFEQAPNAWWSGKSLKWWDGYDGHEDVIIDDFRGDFCTFHELLRILDRYPYTVETKGGSRQLLARRIWLTSCLPPEKIYQRCEEDVQQLLRRIDHVVHVARKLEDGAEVKGNTTETLTPTSALEDNIEENDEVLDL